MGSKPTSSGNGRLSVAKTRKLYIDGAFVRSESGRSFVETGPGGVAVNVAWASRKDVRDAVSAARRRLPAWSALTAYNRGQILYRLAEMIESRSGEFAELVLAQEGCGEAAARAEVEAAVDRWVWYAGWTDKIGHLAASVNPVAGPYFNFSLPEPTGVVAVFAPASLLGITSVLAPVMAAGNVAVMVAGERGSLVAASLAEAVATSDFPAGSVNILTGRQPELAGTVSTHRGIDGLDLSGLLPELRAEAERGAAGSVKRVFSEGAPDSTGLPGVSRVLSFVEVKTVWHPIGI